MKVAGEILSPAWVPVPASAIVTGDPTLPVTVIVPVALPAAIGAKLTERVAVSDGLSVVGLAIPLALKPVPVVETLFICNAAFPVFVNVIVCEALVPSATLPKFKPVVLAVN